MLALLQLGGVCWSLRGGLLANAGVVARRQTSCDPIDSIGGVGRDLIAHNVYYVNFTVLAALDLVPVGDIAQPVVGSFWTRRDGVQPLPRQSRNFPLCCLDPLCCQDEHCDVDKAGNAVGTSAFVSAGRNSWSTPPGIRSHSRFAGI